MSKVTVTHSTTSINNSKIKAMHSTIIGDNNIIKGNHNKIKGNNNVIKGTHNKVEGKNNQIQGSHNKMFNMGEETGYGDGLTGRLDTSSYKSHSLLKRFHLLWVELMNKLEDYILY